MLDQKKINNITVPYSQHYLCSYELFADNKLGIVFQYLLDAYFKNYRTRKTNTGFEIGYRAASKSLVMGRNTLMKCLKKLQDIEAISISENFVIVNVSYYVSVIKLFCYSDANLKEKISKAFLECNEEELVKLGLKTTTSVEEEIQRLSSGWVVSNDTTVVPFDTRVAPNDTTVVPNDTTTDSQVVPFDTRVVSNDTTQAPESRLQYGNGLGEVKMGTIDDEKWYQMEPQVVSNGTTGGIKWNHINKYNKEINKENTGEALKKKGDENLGETSSPRVFFDFPPEAEDGWKQRLQLEKEMLRKKNELEQTEKFLEMRQPNRYENFQEQELKEIIQRPEEHQTVWEQIIQDFWEQLGKDVENLEFWETELSAVSFISIYCSIIKNIQDDNRDIEIDLPQALSVLGFDYTGSDENMEFILDAKKIRNVMREKSEDPQEEEQNDSTPRRGGTISRAEKRKLAMAFQDALNQVADEDIDKLTSIEYAVLLMNDYVEEAKSRGQNKPDEVTKMSFESLLSEWSEKTGVPVEDLRSIFKDLPVRGNKITLHSQQLSVDRIFQYNREHGEDSKVYMIWNVI